MMNWTNRSWMSGFAVLILAAAAPGQPCYAAEGTAAQPVDIQLTNLAFTPKSLHLKRNTRYRLYFVNSGSSGHNFDAPEFFAAVSILPQDQAKVSDGKVEVDEDEAVDVTITPHKAGIYPVRCSHFLHTTFGMT